jgi:glycosyltransferase involved in cell wall biosynthesis
LRAGLLAEYLASRGHTVTWWTSTFDHTQKTHHADVDTTMTLANGVVLEMMRGLGYRRNVSLQRIRDHRRVARTFTRNAVTAVRPDVILASFPTIELAGAAVRFGVEHGIPCVIDIRDLWPDLYYESIPRWLRGLAAPAIALFRAQARRVCRDAYAITGNARTFVDWGLRLAGRAGGANDRHFPFGYSAPEVTGARREKAVSYWEERGIRLGGAPIIGCYFGAIGHQSDFSCLLDAADLLMARDVKFRMVLCGAGERLNELRERSRGNPNVLFTGWIDQPEILALMEAAHLGIAPYWNHSGFVDNLPNKPIEYMAGGLAVVTCISGYLRQLIADQKCGFYYPSGDSEALADVFEQLSADRQALDLAKLNARRVFRENFDSEIVQAGITEYLQTIVHGVGTARAV